jgi:predicted AAA+ superfamily ATPase
MEIDRQLQITPLLAKKSFFLFGPRTTGKSTLIRQQLADTATVIDLLDSRIFLKLSQAPYELESLIAAHPKKIVVVDEIQRIGNVGFRTSTQPTKIKHLTIGDFQGRNPTNHLDEFSFIH